MKLLGLRIQLWLVATIGAILILFLVIAYFTGGQAPLIMRLGEQSQVENTETGASDNADKLTAITDFGRNPGDIAMYIYVPEGVPPHAPLVVALHGCKQDAALYAQNGWLDLADYWKFYLLLPEQSAWNNPDHCWNWFFVGDNRRDWGEMESIRNMVGQMVADYDIDEERIFVEGLSAGGYMAANVLAGYPDIFAAGGISAGGPAYCSPYFFRVWSCMDGEVDRTPEQWREETLRFGYSAASHWPRVSIWHGGDDTRVDIVNQRELVEQWTALHGIDQRADLSNTIQGAFHAEYQDAAGNVFVESYLIPEMTHGIAIDPGFEEANGCGTVAPYLLDEDICAVYYLGRFFGLDQPKE